MCTWQIVQSAAESEFHRGRHCQSSSAASVHGSRESSLQTGCTLHTGRLQSSGGRASDCDARRSRFEPRYGWLCSSRQSWTRAAQWHTLTAVPGAFHSHEMVKWASAFGLLVLNLRYRDSVDNTVEDNSSVFSLIQMHWLLSARACRQ